MSKAVRQVRQTRAQGPPRLGLAARHFRSGWSLYRMGRLEAAAQSYSRALALAPDYVDAWRQLGNVLHVLGRTETAAAAYEMALCFEPQLAEVHYNLGVTRMWQGRFQEAGVCFERTLSLAPGHAEASNNLGSVRHSLSGAEAAIPLYRRALAAKPDLREALSNLAVGLREQGHPEEALEYCRQLMRLQPDSVDARLTAGQALLNLGQPEEAVALLREALQYSPQHSQARWNLAICQLLLGDYRNGFAGFELRFEQHGAVRRPFRAPLWDGSPLNGRSILLYAEQGFGDTLQFVRFAAEAGRRGGNATLECQPELAVLLGTAPGVGPVSRPGSSPASFDCQAPLMSLPYILRVTLETLPGAVPYVHAAPELVESWRERLAPWTGLRAGLVWAGNPLHRNDRNRSLHLDDLAALAGLPEWAFFSLQKGPLAKEAACPPHGLVLVDLGPELPDFAHTAAVMMNLDLVITVDTAAAHLAGALGRPVWTLLPFAPDWRWLCERIDSPWYPSMRLFRQPVRGAWGPVAEAVRNALLELGREHPRGS